MIDMLISNFTLFIISIIILSALVGSFLNVVIYRLPIMLEKQLHAEYAELAGHTLETEDAFNFIVPRSQCPHCKTPISPWHNIPVFSYLFLRGRCQHCHEKISMQYLLVEIQTILMSVMVALVFGASMMCVFALLFTWLLITMIWIDIHHQILPDSLNYSLLWLGLYANLSNLFAPLPSAVIGIMVAYGFFWLLTKTFYLATGKVGMGHGDFKLFAAMGAWLGWQLLPLLIFLSACSGAIVGIIILKIQGETKDTPIPFGPFLSFSGWICLLYGHEIIAYYLTLSGM